MYLLGLKKAILVPWVPGGGGGDMPTMPIRAKRGTFFEFQVYKSVGISQV